MKEKSQRIGIVTLPLSSNAGIIHLSKLIDILCSFSDDIYVITGTIFSKKHKQFHTYGIQYKKRTNIYAKVMDYAYIQLKISYKLIKLSKNVDSWIILCGQGLLLPTLTLKLLKKDVVVALAASPVETATPKIILSIPMTFLSKISFMLSNSIILYSSNLIKEWSLEKYRNKISIAHEHFLDFDKFKIKKKINARDNLVGYVGRLSEEKGTLNFVKAIPKMLEETGEVKFLVGGDGQLRDKIEKYLEEENLKDKVELTGWIPHDELPYYLNELKLVVLPSYTEGLPHIILEAMACGTPVLSTPVGAIPDVIRDGETGFIMENNSPECVAENIANVLNNPNLDKVIKNARELVEKEYTYEAAVEGYRKILESL